MSASYQYVSIDADMHATLHFSGAENDRINSHHPPPPPPLTMLFGGMHHKQQLKSQDGCAELEKYPNIDLRHQFSQRLHIFQWRLNQTLRRKNASSGCSRKNFQTINQPTNSSNRCQVQRNSCEGDPAEMLLHLPRR